MSKITVHVSGHGKVKVKLPKVLTSEAFGEAIASSVNQTMNLVAAKNAIVKFHPVLGMVANDRL